MEMTNTSTQANNATGDEPLPLITVQGIASYLTCRRAWWLAEIRLCAPGDELLSAQLTLSRRKQLAMWLSAAGGLMLAVALLIFVLGILLG